MLPRIALLGLDWGTSSLRGYLIGERGAVLAERSAKAGILHIQNGAFAEALLELAGDWLATDENLPIVASGMIGSRQGWAEAPYVEIPAGAGDLTLHRYDGFDRPVYIVPGLARRDQDGVPDVMRGEETQIVGAHISDAHGHNGDNPRTDPKKELFLLPGSHSKWALVMDRRITWFATFMTGELFAALKDHTILGRMMTDSNGNTGDDKAAFARGVKYGHAKGATLQRLFSARTLALFGELPQTGVAAYLSGLLIGAEIAEARALVHDLSTTITIIGDPDLGQRYLTALSLCGQSACLAPDNAVARGHWRIAAANGLLSVAAACATP
ncbi:MAG: 2-dehydro-3-deoxygalactonokinase [Proteobacteria bacterium]|nr:2-dehydro-3-deoxygalactonokinase [Pseudomonadota bacterium]